MSGTTRVLDLRRLHKVLSSGPITILTHHNPDPDALASGEGLAYLIQTLWGLEVRRVYSGIVARAENVAVLAHLTPGWELISAPDEIASESLIILVDTQPGAGNNLLPASIIPSAVFDHHQPIRLRVDQVPYVDLRPELGAASTLIYLYLEAAGLSLHSRLATALFYGIKTDTNGLSRGTTHEDELTYVSLLKHVDRELLRKVEHIKKSATFYSSIAHGIQNTMVYGSAVLSLLGDMHRPDFAAELADYLIQLEGTRGVFCMGRYQEAWQLSVRTVLLGQDAGLLIQQLIVDIGQGGGHGTMAGGQIPDDAVDENVLKTMVQQRFLVMMEEGETAGIPLITLGS